MHKGQETRENNNESVWSQHELSSKISVDNKENSLSAQNLTEL